MNKYSDIEIQTAKDLLEHGYKYLARDSKVLYSNLYAFTKMPYKDSIDGEPKGDAVLWRMPYDCDSVRLCSVLIPIFQNVRWEDSRPTSLESIVHPPILDDAEKQYLENVIRPFRDNVKGISKGCSDFSGKEFIVIYSKNGDWSAFPWFQPGTMYKGMERGRRYSLEELGL